MKSFVPDYDLRAPANFADALERMAREPGEWHPLAGGTDLMVQLEAGKLPQRKFLSLAKIPEMRDILVEPAEVTLGALTTYTRCFNKNSRCFARRPVRREASPHRIGAHLAGTLPTRLLLPTHRPRCWFTTRNWSWSRHVAPGTCPTTGSTPAISKCNWPRTN